MFLLFMRLKSIVENRKTGCLFLIESDIFSFVFKHFRITDQCVKGILIRGTNKRSDHFLRHLGVQRIFETS